MQWLEHDEVDPAALPAWAQRPSDDLDGRPYTVRVYPEGIRLARGRRASAVRWEEILVPIHLDDPSRLLLGAARKPPRAPWFELAGEDVGEIERAVRTRLEAIEHRGYRDRTRRRDPIPPDEILTQVLARRQLPGAVEIPAATPSIWRSAAIGAALGGATLGLYGLAYGLVGLLAAGGIGALGGGGMLGGVELLRKRSAGRVLVLTPDAFIGGLDGASVRAIPWERVSRFVVGYDDHGEDALEVFDVEDRRVARSGARWFGAPLDVIVAVAEAYRKRAVGER